MWECGLKHPERPHTPTQAPVTPHVGVWIETYHPCPSSTYMPSLPMWECGLKPAKTSHSKSFGRHSPCGSVD